MGGREDRRQQAMGERTARLCRALDEAERLCAELDEMSRRQGAELDAGRAAEAAEIVAARSRVVTSLSGAVAALGGTAEGLERLLEGAPAATAERARKQAAAIAAIVEGVLARDEEDQQLLAAERDRLSQELGGIGRGRSAIGAYTSGARPDPTMQDRKG